MGLFGKSFGEKVQDAVAVLNKSDLGVRNLRATADGKVVTLEGQAVSLDAKGRVMLEFNKMVATENTINKIQVQGAPAAPPIPGPGPAPVGEATVYEVKPGDTLGAIAQRFTGKRAFTPRSLANRDILNNP
jgi:LysM repeat protein